jgi:hypothetical protein
MKAACIQTLLESELSFMCYIFQYLRKLQIYHISKLLHVFLNILFVLSFYIYFVLKKQCIFHCILLMKYVYIHVGCTSMLMKGSSK